MRVQSEVLFCGREDKKGMIKFRLLLGAVVIILLLSVLVTAVIAQEETPPPYAGLENPFSWEDTSARDAGQAIYQRTCMGCHGADGSNIAGADFSTLDFAQSLEESPDFPFWILSEGRLDIGMPPFKFSLSEEQRWQVLTHIRSLGAEVAPPEVPPAPAEPSPEAGVSLLLSVPEQAQSGQPLTMTATLHDNEGIPIDGAIIKFFIKVDFFATGLMEIGEAVTNGEGVAVFEYTPRQSGERQVTARYEANETSSTIILAPSDIPFYQPQVGITLPSTGEEIFIGPESARELGEGGKAPASTLRLPGGILSWLLLFILTVMLIWFTYVRVLYQVFRIPIVDEIEDTNTRLIPMAGIVLVVVMGILLVIMVITGPYSHLHLFR